jgi:hypothetical protein
MCVCVGSATRRAALHAVGWPVCVNALFRLPQLTASTGGYSFIRGRAYVLVYVLASSQHPWFPVHLRALFQMRKV